MSLRTVGVRLTAETTDFIARMRTAQASVRSFHQEMGDRAAAGKLDKLADAAGTMGLGLAAGFGYAVKAAADFDKQMSAVKAATNDSTLSAGQNAAAMKQLRAAALQAGKDTSFSASEAANGVTELGKAGVATKDILSGGLSGALNLAAAGQMDVGEAAETAATAMTQFKLSGKDIPHIADLLAAGAGKAQGSVHDMGYALKAGGLVAANFGLSIEDTTGALAEFASAGLVGSDAGTSFKSMIQALQNPSGKAADTMADLGISVYDASGKFVGMSNLAGQLHEKLGGLTQATRDQAMAQIFGSDGIRAATVLYKDGASGVEDWKNKVNDSGFAAKTASQMTDNLAGDIDRLKGSLETMAIQGGSGANGGLRTLVKGLNSVIDKILELPPAVTSTMTVLVAVGAALLLGSAAWVKYRKMIAATKLELEGMGPVGVRASAGISKATAAIGKAGAVMAGLEIAGQAVNAAFGSDIKSNTDALAASLTDWAEKGTKAGEAARIFGSDFSRLDYDLGTAGTGAMAKTGNAIAGIAENVSGLGGVFDETLEHANQRFGQLDETLSAMVQNGNGAQAAEIFAKLSDEAKKNGQSVNDLKAKLPTYASAMAAAASGTKGLAGAQADAAGAAGTAAGATKGFKTATEAATAAIQGELEAFSDLADKMKSESDPVFGLIEAEGALADAQKAAAKATKEHGKNSREAQDATIALGRAAIDLQDKVGALGSAFDGKLSPELLATFKAAGLTKGQIADLTKDFGSAKKAAEDYDGDYKGNATAPGAKDAKKQFDDAAAAALGFDGNYKGNASAPGAKSAAAEIQTAWDKANGFDGNYKANLSSPGAKNAEQAAADAWAQAKGFDGQYNAKLTISGNDTVDAKLADLLIKQRALQTGLSYSSAKAAVQKDLDRNRQRKAVGGFIDGPGTETSDSIPALLSKNEFVIKASSAKKLGFAALAHMNHTGELPRFASGGTVNFKFPTNVSKTKVPTESEMLGKLAGAAFTGGGSAGKGQLAAWIMQAIGLTHVPANWAGPLRTLIMRESGGNPNAINLWDSNAKAGHPSQGLMQTIPSTFNAYKLPGLGGITNPIANIVAGIRYILSRYGSIFNVQQANANASPKGYASGGLVGHTAMAGGGIIGEPVFGVGRSGRTYSFGELGPERVIPHYATGGLVNFASSSGGTSVGGGSKLDTASAMLDAKSAVDALTQSLKENGRTWSTNTAKGRDNRNSLINGVKAAQDAAKAKYAETGSVKSANKVYADYIKALDASMKKMGVNSATRKSLIKAYSEQPKYDLPTSAPSNSSNRVNMVTDQMGVEEALSSAKQAFAWTKPSFNVKTDSGRAELQELFSFLNSAGQLAQSSYNYNGSKTAALKIYNDYVNQLRSILAARGLTKARIDDLMKTYARITLQPRDTANRWGGVYEHAQDGALKDATLASGGPTRYAWAEPATGGELFAPKHGNLAKTRSQVGWAVQNWWGGNVTWGRQQGNAPMVINATIPVTLGSQVITQQVRLEVDMALGQVANATVYQTA